MGKEMWTEEVLGAVARQVGSGWCQAPVQAAPCCRPTSDLAQAPRWEDCCVRAPGRPISSLLKQKKGGVGRGCDGGPGP